MLKEKLIDYLPFHVFLVALTLFIGGPLGSHFEKVEPITGISFFITGAVLSFISGIIGLVYVFLGRFSMGIPSFILGLMPCAVIVFFMMQANELPLINDISTDLVSPPEYVHARTLGSNATQSMAFEKKNVPEIKKAYPSVKTAIFKTKDIQKVYKKALNISQYQLRWKVTKQDSKAYRIEAIDTSPLFKFKDDIVIRIQAEENQVIVDLRSRSRVGKGDMGANANRIKLFLEALNKEML